MSTAVETCSITGRFTIPELEHLAGTMMWNKGVPETTSERRMLELNRLVEMARAYVDGVKGAYAVDILENQILNVVTR